MAIKSTYKHNHFGDHSVIEINVGNQDTEVLIDRSHSNEKLIFLFVNGASVHINTEEAEEIALSLLMLAKEINDDQ